MDLQATLALALATLAFAVTPGPGTLAALAVSTRHGAGPGILLCLGQASGDLMYLGLALFSLGTLTAALAPALAILKYPAALYIIYLGMRQFLAREIRLRQGGAPKHAAKYLLTGFLISGTNPKVMVYYLSILPLFVNLETLGPPEWARVMATVGLTVFGGLSAVCILGGVIGKMLERPRAALWVNRTTGAIMLAVGVAVAVS